MFKDLSRFLRRFLQRQKLHGFAFVNQQVIDLIGQLVDDLQCALPLVAVIEQPIRPRQVEQLPPGFLKLGFDQGWVLLVFAAL